MKKTLKFKNIVAASEHPSQSILDVIPLFSACRRHLTEAEMGYWPHLTHAFHQSNRLVAVAIKSYIHGIFPLWFKADGPKTIIRIYHEIRRIRHIDRIARAMEKDILP